MTASNSEVDRLRALLEDIFTDWRSVDLETVTDAEREAIEFVLAQEARGR